MSPRTKHLLALLLLIRCLAQDRASPTIYDRIQPYWKAKNYAKSAEILQQVLVETQKSENIDGRYETLGWLRSAYQALGDTNKAIATGNERLALLQANRAHFAKALFPGNTPGGGALR